MYLGKYQKYGPIPKRCKIKKNGNGIAVEYLRSFSLVLLLIWIAVCIIMFSAAYATEMGIEKKLAIIEEIQSKGYYCRDTKEKLLEIVEEQKKKAFDQVYAQNPELAAVVGYAQTNEIEENQRLIHELCKIDPVEEISKLNEQISHDTFLYWMWIFVPILFIFGALLLWVLNRRRIFLHPDKIIFRTLFSREEVQFSPTSFAAVRKRAKSYDFAFFHHGLIKFPFTVSDLDMDEPKIFSRIINAWIQEHSVERRKVERKSVHKPRRIDG